MRNVLLFTILITLLSVNLVFSQLKPGMKASEYCSARKSHGKELDLKMLSPNTPKHSFDVLKYKLNLDLFNCFVSPYLKTFSASVIIDFRVDSSLNSIQLNAVNTSLQIDSVRLAGISYSHQNNLLNIQLNQSYNPGAEIQVKIYYKHKNVSDNAFYVNTGMVFTDCEPQGARKWFPCWDQPSDKALLDLTARVPLTVKLGSNGRLNDSTIVGNAISYHWISRDPISTYLVTMSGKVGYKLDVVNWVSPTTDMITPIRFYYNQGEDPSYIKSIIGEVTTYFSQIFVEHPFEKNGFATLNSDFAWGGMENQTLTSLCPGCWDEMLAVHEYAHQWFGDMITCATWADIWINEGWATYSESLWKEHTDGYTGYKADVDNNASSYMNSNPGWAISNLDWAINPPELDVLFNYSITYAKGACVLHLLRYVIGDENFFNVLHQYASDAENFKYKNATIMDFAAKVNEVTGQDYNWFFEQWIYQPNHPVYSNKYKIHNLGNGHWAVSFMAKQTQTNSGFFKMPLELKVGFSFTDTLLKVFNDVNEQTYTFIFDKQPTSFSFDPDNQIVLKQASTTVGDLRLLTVLEPVSGGSVNPPAGYYTFKNNQSITLTAVTDSGFQFDFWTIDGVQNTNNPVSIVMNSNKTIGSQFSPTIGIHNVFEQSLQIFPNPANSLIYVTYTGDIKSDMEIINVLGEKLYSRTINNETLTIAIEDWEQGIYFIRIENGKSKITQKIAIMKK